MKTVEMLNITKSFAGVKANDDVTVKVSKGEIHALVGENGAGKSTLMKILYGMYHPDAGRIFINGKEEKIDSPSKAIKLGIGMVHQHFMLVPPLTVKENIILGNETINRFGKLNIKKADEEVRKLSEKFNIKINPQAKIENLSVGMEQRVEILKILYRNAEILILDEPTAVLTPQEVDELFITLRNLKNEGKTIIIISHKLKEIMDISDRVTVMSHGKITGEVITKSSSKEEIARMMIGRDIDQSIKKTHTNLEKEILIVENLSGRNDRGLIAFKNISFEIKSGEILGIAGVEGNGQTELIEVLTGLREKTSGSFNIKSNNKKIAHIPEDRIKRGIVSDFAIAENMILGRQNEKMFSSGIMLNKKYIEQYSEKLVKDFDVRPPRIDIKAGQLSGGNQQKMVIARELSKDADVIIVSHPSRGLDISATDFIHRSILSQRNSGKAVLLVSSDLSEVLKLSDRVAVIYNGEITAFLNPKEVTERDLGVYMTGSEKLNTDNTD